MVQFLSVPIYVVKVGATYQLTEAGRKQNALLQPQKIHASHKWVTVTCKPEDVKKIQENLDEYQVLTHGRIGQDGKLAQIKAKVKHDQAEGFTEIS